MRGETQVFVDAARYVAQVPVDDGKLLIGHALHEIAVVRDEDERTRPAVEQVLDDGEHIGIEVVARLVQNEDVGLLEDGEQEHEAAALAAREIADAAPKLLRGEAQALEELLGARLLAIDHVDALIARKHLANRVSFERLELIELLRKHAEAHRLANLHPARKRSELALDDIDEGRFARAVVAKQAVAVAGADEPGHVLEHRLARLVSRIDIDHVDDLFAEARHRKALELEFVAQGRDVGDELPRRLDAEFRLRAARLCAAGQPRELLASHVATALLGNLGQAVALDALQDIGGVATLEGVDAPVVHLPHGGADLVEKPAVVGDHQERPLAGLPARFEMIGEPIDGAHVEMVGGLVEHEDVVVADEQAREVDAAALAARERTHGALPGDIGDEAVDDVPDAGARGPFVFGRVAHDGMVDGVSGVERVALAQEPHGEAAPVRDATVVGLERAGEHRKQRRLAVAVLAHDADAVTLVYAERHVVEHAFGGIFELNGIAAKKNRHNGPFTVDAPILARGACYTARNRWKELPMGGCCVIVLIPILMGMGIVMAALFFALPLYAVIALIMVLLAVAAYLVLRKHDMFTRYEADGTWRGPAATVVKWLLRFDIAFFVLTGVAAIVSWFVVYH